MRTLLFKLCSVCFCTVVFSPFTARAEVFYSPDQAESYAAYLLCVEAKSESACESEKPDLSVLVIDGKSFPKDADLTNIDYQSALMKGGLYLKKDGAIGVLSSGNPIQAIKIDRGKIVIEEDARLPAEINVKAIILDPSKQDLGLGD